MWPSLRKRFVEKVFAVVALCSLVSVPWIWSRERVLTHSPSALVATAPNNQLRARELGVGPATAQGKKQLQMDSTRQGTRDCAARRPDYLFVVRIAKCASTSIVTLLQGLSRERGFPYIFHGSGAYNWDQREVESVENVCRSRRYKQSAGSRGRAVADTVVYIRHFYYTPFPRLGSSVWYITFVREPVARVVSSYFYYHFSSKPRLRGLVPPDRRQEGLVQCVQQNHEGCTANLMTKYFCGHEQFCASGSPTALQQAKYNLQRHFLVVGVVEEMKASLGLLALLLPDIFGSGRSADAMPLSNQNKHFSEVNEQERQIIAEHNMADVELYAFAVRELEVKLKQCHVNSS